MRKKEARASDRLFIHTVEEGTRMVGWGPETIRQVLKSSVKEAHQGKKTEWQETQRKHVYTEVEEKMSRSSNEHKSSVGHPPSDLCNGIG